MEFDNDEWDETLTELIISLGKLPEEINDNPELVVKRWQRWTTLFPNDTLPAIHQKLQRRKQYALRLAYDCLVTRHAIKEDSPLRDILALQEHMALIDLRRADVSWFMFLMDGGWMKVEHEDKVYLCAGLAWNVNDWIYGEMWQMQSKSSKKRHLPKRHEAVGPKPMLYHTTKELMKSFVRSMRLLAHFGEQSIGDLMNLEGEKMDESFFRSYVKKVGVLVQSINATFEEIM